MTEKTAQKEPGKKPVPSKKPKPQQEVVVQIPLSELHPFPDHPFQVREDASMSVTARAVYRPHRRSRFTSILSGDSFLRRLEKWSLPRRN